MKTRDEYITDLRNFKAQFADQYGIRVIGIYGSVARGEHTAQSDLDVFVDVENPDYFIMCDIREGLEQVCGCEIDLLRLRPDLRSVLIKRIEQDGIVA